MISLCTPTTLGLRLQYAVGDEILARGVRIDNRAHQALRHIRVVGQQLLGVFRQAVAAIAEGRIVVMIANARVEADALDDLPGIQSMRGGVGVEFVEVSDTHRQVGIGEQLDRFGFGGICEQHLDVLLDRALLEQAGEGFGPRRAFADDDARRVQVVV